MIDVQDTSLGNTPQFSVELQPIADALHSMQIPVDGGPNPPTLEEDLDSSWDDDPEPAYKYSLLRQPVVAAETLRVIAFDLYGAVFVSLMSFTLVYSISLVHSFKDRESAIQDALAQLVPVESSESAAENLWAYLECESLKSSTHPDMPTYRDLARASLRDFIKHFNIIADEKALESALDQLLRPRIYEDAIPAISALHAQGYTLLAIPPIDSATFRQHMLPNLPPELSICTSSQTLLALFCQNESSFLNATRVLSITASGHQTVSDTRCINWSILSHRTCKYCRFSHSIHSPGK